MIQITRLYLVAIMLSVLPLLAENTLEYELPNGGTITIPDDWQLFQSTQQGTVAIGEPEVMSLTITSVPTAYITTRTLRFMFYSLQKKMAEVKATKLHPARSVGDVRYVQVDVTASVQGFPVNIKLVSVNSHYNNYTFFFTINHERYNEVQSTIGEIIQSFKAPKTSFENPTHLADAESLEPLKPLLNANIANLNTAFLAQIIKDGTNYETLKSLLDQGADLNAGPDFVTPLLAAIRKNDVKKVKWLLDHGAETYHVSHENLFIQMDENPALSTFLANRYHEERKRFPDYPDGFHKSVTLTEDKLQLEGMGAEQTDTELLHENLAFGNLDDARIAIGNGADVNAVVEKWNKRPLELVRGWIEDMTYLGGDVKPFRELEASLIEAGAQ